MKLINSDNKGKAIAILNSSFQKNAGVLWVVKKDKSIKKRIEELCRYCLTVAIEKEGAYISQKENGVVLLFDSNKKQTIYNFIHGYYRLGNYCIGWNRALKIINRERNIKSYRPKSRYLYGWMLGISDSLNGLNTLFEIKDFAFQYSYEMKLPIYAETTSTDMLKLYERYGFKLYDTWDTNENGVIVYFILRDWNC